MNNRKEFFQQISLILLSPVFALISGASNIKNKLGKTLFVIFVGIFGYTFIITPGKDSYEHAVTFQSYYQQLEMNEFLENIKNMFLLKPTGRHADEPYLEVVSFLLAQITSNPSWLFLVAGMIYGFFFINGISLVYSEIRRNWDVALIILFIFFVSWKNLEGLNSIQNWTAAWIFFNGAFLYFKTQNRKYILLVLLAPFFHFGYLAITFPFIAYLFLKDRRHFFVIILLFSFFISAGTEFLESYIGATELGETKLNAYLSDETDINNQVIDDRSFHAKYYRTASDTVIKVLFIHAIIFLGYLSGKGHDRLQTSLGSLAILMLAFANFVQLIPALNNRIFVNFGLYALAYLLRLYSIRGEEIGFNRALLYLFTPGILLYLFTTFSLMGDYVDIRIIMSPLTYPFMGNDPISIKGFIRSLL